MLRGDTPAHTALKSVGPALEVSLGLDRAVERLLHLQPFLGEFLRVDQGVSADRLVSYLRGQLRPSSSRARSRSRRVAVSRYVRLAAEIIAEGRPVPYSEMLWRMRQQPEPEMFQQLYLVEIYDDAALTIRRGWIKSGITQDSRPDGDLLRRWQQHRHFLSKHGLYLGVGEHQCLWVYVPGPRKVVECAERHLERMLSKEVGGPVWRKEYWEIPLARAATFLHEARRLSCESPPQPSSLPEHSGGFF